MIANPFPSLAEMKETIREETQPVELASGAFICMDGNMCQSLALVMEGRARVYKMSEQGREITLYRVEPGESCILTASCILSNRPFPAFAVADTGVRARLVSASTVRRWMNREPVWRRYVFDLVAGRLDTVIATLEEVAFRRLDTRLARLLLEESETEDGRRTLRATHKRLAADLGSAREVVSRLLKDFEQEGLVNLERSLVRIVDPVGLRRAGRGARR